MREKRLILNISEPIERQMVNSKNMALGGGVEYNGWIYTKGWQ